MREARKIREEALREAAGAECGQCRQAVPVEGPHNGRYVHRYADNTFSLCPAFRILNLICLQKGE